MSQPTFIRRTWVLFPGAEAKVGRVASPRPLPHSRPADVAANRDARVRGRQLAALVYAGVWRILLGLPTTAGGVALALGAPGSAATGGGCIGFLVPAPACGFSPPRPGVSCAVVPLLLRA